MIGIVLSSLTFPYLVRRLGVDLYGLWSYVVACCAFFTNIANPGLNAYVAQQVAARRKEALEMIPDVLVLRTIATAIAIVLLLGFTVFDRRADVRYLLRFYGVGALLVGLTNADHLLSALEMFHVRSLLAVLQQALYAIGIFLLVRSPKEIVWLPISILASALLTNLPGWFFLYQQGLRLQHLQPGRWKRILVPSGHYAMSTLMSNLYHRTGHLLVRWFLGEHALGLYAAAVRFLEIIEQFFALVLSVFMPRIAIAAKSDAEVGRLARMAVTVTAVVNIPVMAGVLSTTHLAVPWVLGTQFLEDVHLLRWMSPHLLMAPASSLLAGTILYALGRHRAYFASTAIGALAGLVSYIVLIPTLGLTGAALAFVCGQFFVAAAAYALLSRNLHGLLKNPYIAMAVTASVLMVAVVRIVNSYTSRPVLVFAAGALVYVLLCAWPVKRWLLRELGV